MNSVSPRAVATAAIEEPPLQPIDPSLAPVRRQYLQIKQRFPDTLLLFRLGDFYETFEQDAEVAASLLDIMLTSREMGKGVRVPMAGIPHHAADGYIARLVAAGHKVAVCEQTGAPSRGRGLLDRDVTRVVTPGTVTDPAMLDALRNTYVAAVALEDSRVGIAYADLSTGEFAATEIGASSAADARIAASHELHRLGAVEVVLPAIRPGAEADGVFDWLPKEITVSTCDRWLWRQDRAAEVLCQHFAVASLDGFGLAGFPAAVKAAGALLAYVIDTQRSSLAQIKTLRAYSSAGFMVLDAQARRALELTESTRGEKRRGLIAVLDQTQTAMGARLLRRWLAQPLLDRESIERRHAAVQRYVDDPVRRASLRESLGGLADIERLANRAVMGAISPRELAALRQALDRLDAVAAEATDLPGSPPLGEAHTACQDVRRLLERALAAGDPGQLGSGGVIRPGFVPELDALDRGVREARAWIAGLERAERERTGIRTLKVGYNRVLGYYIEITASVLAAIEKKQLADAPTQSVLPASYLARQTLANCTRFVTAELKEAEARVLGAQETVAQLEADTFARIVGEIAAYAAALCEVAAVAAFIDVVAALAEVASARGYVRPEVDDSLMIDIRAGRHPTLEAFLSSGEFVPNDARLDTDASRITILTGPNMAGKSSWLRQTALIVLMAQIGSFVPASSARIGLVDRIFARIGAQDDISAGQSTFMVEMVETASILHQASPRSLVLLDEIGRGTSTWDGLAIARAVVEYLHNAPRLGCRTLFATHFLELTALADVLPGVCCARMDVLEDGDRVVFLHRVVPGAADRSYGIHVAELAGVPRALTRRASEILTELERGAGAEHRRVRTRSMAAPLPGNGALQLTLFAPQNPAVQALQNLDVETLSPLEALQKLYELKHLAAEESATESD